MEFAHFALKKKHFFQLFLLLPSIHSEPSQFILRSFPSKNVLWPTGKELKKLRAGYRP
jgi:aminoglycoside/choline kinase family phosphotransferase